MKIAVLGTGAVGGFFGGKLANAKHDVTFIARGKTLEVLQSQGLRVKSYMGGFTIKNPKITSDLGTLRSADLILFCVKSYSTAEIAKILKEIISDKAVIISMQNGVDNEEILSEILGAEKIMGSVVYITSSCPEPGLIKHTSSGKVILGELNGVESDRLKRIEKMFLSSGIPTISTKNIKRELWKKLMLNIPFNGFTALTKKTLKNYLSIPESNDCFYRSLKEVQLIAKHEGYKITDEEVDEIFSVCKNEHSLNFKSSTLQDLEAGKPLEIESLQGAVIRIAQKHKLDTPINKLLYTLLKVMCT